MSKSNHRVAAVAAGAAILVSLGSFGAVASGMITGKDIKDGSIHKADIGRNAVGAGEIKPGAIKMSDLSDKAVQGMQGEQGPKGETGAAGPAGKDGAQGPKGDKGDPATLSANSVGGPVVITDIGGNFGKFTGTVRATLVDSFKLAAGTHQLTSNGFFHSIAATSGDTRLQLALRVRDGSDWGQDFGTCFTDAASPLNDRETTCSTTRVVQVAQSTVVEVYAFGYADDQGSADSGKFKATAYTSAIKVG